MVLGICASVQILGIKPKYWARVQLSGIVLRSTV